MRSSTLFLVRITLAVLASLAARPAFAQALPEALRVSRASAVSLQAGTLALRTRDLAVTDTLGSRRVDLRRARCVP